MKTRNWSIRSKIIALVVVPLSALLALWIFATVLTAGPALNLLSARTLLNSVGNPGEVLVGELQRERRLSVVYLSDPEASPAALTAQRSATDRAAADFRHAVRVYKAEDVSSPALRAGIRQIFVDLDALPGNRAYVDGRRIDAVGAQNNFNNIIDTAFQMFEATATFGDEEIDSQIRALTTMGHGQEFLSRVDALLAGANAAGRFDTDGRRDLLKAASTAPFLLAEGVNGLPAAERTAFQRISNGASFTRLRQMEETLLSASRAGQPSPVSTADWQPAFDQSTQQLRAFNVNAAAGLADRAMPVAVNILIRLGAAGLLGLIALVVSLVVSIRVGRSLVGRLRRLRVEAIEMAGERLPSVVHRLQRGEPVDVDVETPPLEYGKDEIGQVGQAFNQVQRTAVQSAVEEANVRRGINEVFLNIARRSQTLLHRQLALLDKMERRETGPDELEDLYRVDHLATRMRRHAEDLVILAGAAPGRGWRNPVAVIDVVRGAISEVEDYKRIDIRSIESSAVLGRAVGDVIHLLAELLENAASFSPPQTRVVVAGQVLPNGYAIEIEDRGLGMSPEAIEEANRRLVEPPDFDPADSARLGLFVVAQLAARHGVRVSLRQSAWGGVAAIVLIPGELVTMVAGPMALPAGPTPADQSWDRPLVGSGNDDPARHSLAALQWQGTEELRSITVTGRPVSTNGAAWAAPGTNELPLVGGPSQSAVADGLSPDGLVQRRRNRPRQSPSAAPEQLPAGPEGIGSPGALESPSELPTRRSATHSPAGLESPTQYPAGLESPSQFPAGLDSSTQFPAGLDSPSQFQPGLDSPSQFQPGLDSPTPFPAGLDSPTPFPAGLDGPTLYPAGLESPSQFPAGLEGLGQHPAGLESPTQFSAGLESPAGLFAPRAPMQFPAGLESPDEVLGRSLPELLAPPTPATAPPVEPFSPPGVDPSSAAVGLFPASPGVPVSASPAAPVSASPAAPVSVPPVGPAEPVGDPPAAEDGLPKRVRQASLAPQLRAPAVEPIAPAPRSPDQVRNLMSALQWGTKRGRLAAAGLDATGEPPRPGEENTLAEAATVTFPAVRADGETDNAQTNDAAGGTAANGDQLNRPEKDS